MADILVMGGYRDAGYEYVMIDDCWSMIDRDPINHRLIPDQTRFPNGIAHLADYVRKKHRLVSSLYARRDCNIDARRACSAIHFQLRLAADYS